jgi:hypothetical protein
VVATRAGTAFGTEAVLSVARSKKPEQFDRERHHPVR